MPPARQFFMLDRTALAVASTLTTSPALRGLAMLVVTGSASGCGCPEGVFATQCGRVRDRAVEHLDCPNVRTSRKERAEVTVHSSDDADTYTVCCNFGSRACAYYVCPKGRPDSACHRAD